MTDLKKILLVVAISFLAISAVARINNNLVLFASLVVNLLVASPIILGIFGKKNFLPKNLQIFLILAIFLISVGVSTSGILNELEKFRQGYKFDGFLFLNTSYLISQGQNYWQAYTLAFEEDIRFDGPPSDFWGWRLSTIFYLWSILGGGLGVWIVFIISSLAALFISFKINQKAGNLAILAPLILLPYFLFGASTEWFLAIEWWGLFAFIAGIYFYQIGKLKFAWTLFLLAILIRELFAIPVFANFLASIIFNRKRALFFGSQLVIFALFLFGHFLVLRNFVQLNLGSFAVERFLAGGWNFILQTLAFGSANYLFINFRVFSLYLLILFAGLGLIFLKLKSKVFTDITIVSFLSFAILYTFFGTPRWHEYWGITYIPLMFLLLPKVLGFYQTSKW